MTTRDAAKPAIEILEDSDEITLAELSRTCRIHAEWVVELVEEGVVEPLQSGRSQWRFSSASIVRVQKAQRLHRDLGLNMPGVALALQLLDRIEELEAHLRARSEAPPPEDAE